MDDCAAGLMKGVDYWVINQLSYLEEIAKPKDLDEKMIGRERMVPAQLAWQWSGCACCCQPLIYPNGDVS